MNVPGIAALLIITLLVVLVASYFFGTALGPAEISALRTLSYILLGSWATCFVLGEWTGNVSQVDRLWSLLPIAYAWVVAGRDDHSPRLLLMVLLVTAWGLRLTWNFSRHGGYRLKFWRAHEDYRWQILRAKPEFRPRWKWTLFNLVFISGYQNVLILLMTLPAVVALQFRDTPLGPLDYLAAALMLFMIAFEAVADNQQWRFQSRKRALAEAGQTVTGDYARGFLAAGLWAYSRHPNYFAEQGVWIAFYLFSVAASGQWVNWSISGCILLMILFRGSSAFSEEISAGKYPEYRSYQRRVPRFVPLKVLTRGSRDS
jgi:steroid 5-alpha reductase family enzyme